MCSPAIFETCFYYNEDLWIAATYNVLLQNCAIFIDSYSPINEFYSFISFRLLINAVKFSCFNTLSSLTFFFFLNNIFSVKTLFGPLYSWYCSESISIFIPFHCFYISWCCKLFPQAVVYWHLWCYFLMFCLWHGVVICNTLASHLWGAEFKLWFQLGKLVVGFLISGSQYKMVSN